MKSIRGLFADVTYTKVEYVKNDINNEPFHVWKKEGVFGTWCESYPYKTLAEAEEFAKSRSDSVVYMGLYENGKRKGMTDWEDRKEVKPIPAPLPYALPPDEEVELTNRRTRRLSKG